MALALTMFSWAFMLYWTGTCRETAKWVKIGSLRYFARDFRMESNLGYYNRFPTWLAQYRVEPPIRTPWICFRFEGCKICFISAWPQIVVLRIDASTHARVTHLFTNSLGAKQLRRCDRGAESWEAERGEEEGQQKAIQEPMGGGVKNNRRCQLP